MTDTVPGGAPLDEQTMTLARDIAAHVEDYLGALQAIARDGDPGSSIPLLLLEVGQISLTGARLGAQVDIRPEQEFQPDVGPEPDLDDLRMRLAEILGEVDTYSFVFDPYRPEVVESQLSDDLVTIAADLDNGMRHLRDGNVAEALWWWQFSYVSSWGPEASAVLRALQSVITHDRLDSDFESEQEDVAAAERMLDTSDEVD
jgi:hypothetical protein